MTRRVVCLCTTLLLAVASTASAQVISIKTVPLAQPDQFDIFPARTLSMGGVSIALIDTLYDLSVNPAKGARLEGARFFSSPFLYSVSQQAGGGRTLPLGTVAKWGSWFGGISLALQQVDMPRVNPAIRPLPVALVQGRTQIIPQPQLGTGPPRGNQMAYAMVGRSLGGSGLSLAGSFLWANLNALDGVDFLYSGSSSVVQSGHALDSRLGLVKEWGRGQAFEALLVTNLYDMIQDVTFLDTFWDPATQQARQQPRLERNLDQTNTWGVHLAYQQPLREGWRVGALATGNRLFHPEIPTYDMTQVGVQWIPWDPGDSWAYNLGIGASKVDGGMTFGVDVIYEPIWTHTWGEAHAPTATRLGDTIAVGGRTVDNYFRFSNAIVRMGFGQDVPIGQVEEGKTLGLQLGLALHSINYQLAQYDWIQAAGRNQPEHWVEWTPTWGLSLRFPELEIRYQGRVTNGTGRPGVQPSNVRFLEAPNVAAGSIVAAPDGPLTLGDVTVASHQVSISFPLGRIAGRGGAR